MQYATLNWIPEQKENIKEKLVKSSKVWNVLNSHVLISVSLFQQAYNAMTKY